MQYKTFYAYLFENSTIVEGVDDPGAFKAVLLMGGPGSGKSYVSSNVFGIPNNINFGAQGLKMIGADVPFEYLLHKNNIPLDLATYFSTASPEEQDRVVGKGPNSLRSRAQKIKDFQLQQAEDSGLGFIYDSTSKDPDETKQYIRHLKSKGYDVSVLFVDTPLEVALSRNRARPRKLSDDVVKSIHAEIRKFVGGIDFKEEGAKFFRIENNEGADATKILQTQVGRALKKVIDSPLQNPKGRELVKKRVGAAVTRSTDRRLGKKKQRKPTTPEEKLAKYEEILDMPIKNPKTGRIIKIATVMSKGESHPAYRAAINTIKQHMARR